MKDEVGTWVPGEGVQHVVDARTGEPIDEGLVLPEIAWFYWPSARGDRVYVSMDGGQVWIADAATDRWSTDPIRVESSKGTVQDVIDLSATTDGTLLAIASENFDGQSGSSINDAGVNTEVRIFDGTSGMTTGPVHSGADAVAIRDDGLLAIAYRGSLVLVDSATMKTVRELPGARGAITNLQFSDDGTVLMATADDQSVSIYDPDAGIRLGAPLPSASPRYPYGVTGLGEDMPAAAPTIYPGYLRPDGQAAIVTVAEGVAEWDLDPADLSDAACKLAGRNLTKSEWSSYAAALGPYRLTCPGPGESN